MFFDIFDMDDFSLIFVIMRSTEILIESNISLWMYVPSILKKRLMAVRPEKTLNLQRERSLNSHLVSSGYT